MPQPLRTLDANPDGPVVALFFNPGSRDSDLAASQVPTLQGETDCSADWWPVRGIDIRALRSRDPFGGEPARSQYDWGALQY